jgi:hypothetical protein
MAEKHQQLHALFESNSSDAARIGQLSLDLYNLRRWLNPSFEPFHGQALPVLTPEQQTKLADLKHAFEVGGAASQAVMLNLIPRLPIKAPVRPVFQAESVGELLNLSTSSGCS